MDLPVSCQEITSTSWLKLAVFPSLWSLQSLFFSCECGRSDAARALSSRCTDRPGHPTPCSPDQHAEPRGGGVRCHHQQPHTPRLHRRQGLCQDLGHQPTRQQEPRVPTRLSGKVVFIIVFIAGRFQVCVIPLEGEVVTRCPTRAEPLCAHVEVSAIGLNSTSLCSFSPRSQQTD